MEKRQFKYLNKTIRMIYYTVIMIPVIVFLPMLIDTLEGLLYWAVNFILLFTAMLLIGLVTGTDKLPGLKMTGCYYKDNGTIILETQKGIVKLDNVNEIFLSDRDKLTKSFLLSIKNGDKSYDFMSEISPSPEAKGTDLEVLFCHILEENPDLVQEKDIFGEPIEYWYKRPVDKAYKRWSEEE